MNLKIKQKDGTVLKSYPIMTEKLNPDNKHIQIGNGFLELTDDINLIDFAPHVTFTKNGVKYYVREIFETNPYTEFTKNVNIVSNIKNYDNTIQYSSLTSFETFPGGNKFRGATLVNDKYIYLTPATNNYVVKVDITTEKKINIGGNYGTNADKWSGSILGPNGKIYCFPCNDSRILIIDTSTDYVSTLYATSADSFNWFCGSLAPNGKIYCPPDNGTSILIIDTTNDTVKTIGTFDKYGSHYKGAIIAKNGKIYCVPYNATNILVIDPETETTRTFGNLPGNFKWIGGVLAPNGKIYCIPCNATSILVIDPETETVETFGNFTGEAKWAGGVLGADGNIYAMSSCNPNFLKIDPISKTTQYILSHGINNSCAYGGVLAPNGNIYVTPLNGFEKMYKLNSTKTPEPKIFNAINTYWNKL
ncbi:hypothetical protein [Cetobacterium sp.]|uniref:hypothetical protein n=1 Tax=Cetobacterium sp. TaxID=2071632 RepID=UPI003F3BA48F